MSTNTNKDIRRVSLYLPPQVYEMVDALKEQRGDVSQSETIKEAIRQYHAKRFPVYATRSEEASSSSETTSQREKRLKVQMQDKEIRKKMKEDHNKKVQLAICEALDGRVDGNHCIYFAYDGRDRYEQHVPLNRLSQDLVDTQYSPSREKVESLQAQGKTNYHGTNTVQ